MYRSERHDGHRPAIPSPIITFCGRRPEATMTMRSLLSTVAVAASAALLPANRLALGLSTARIRPSPSSSVSSLPLPSSSFSSSGLPRPPRILLESTVEERLDGGTRGGGSTTTGSEDNLSPFLRDMVDEQRELQLNVGRAMDVLRKDYPYFLKRAPDYSIYHESISLTASDGQLQISKLPAYQKTLRAVRTMLSLLYDVDRSVVQSRMVYDAPRTQIRVSFNAMLVPKIGGAPLHVDGISVYSLDLSATRKEDERGNVTRNEGAGKVIEHKVERILVNGVPMRPPYFGIFGLEGATVGQGTGALAGAGAWS
ncbi:hypothetical protein ACHAWF_007327 [Thalassiosira exigua]